MLVGPRWLQLLVLLLLFLGTLVASPKLIVWEGNPLAQGTGAPIDTSPLGQSSLVDYLRGKGYNISLSLGDAIGELNKGYQGVIVFIGAPRVCSENTLSLYHGLVEAAVARTDNVVVVVADEDKCYERLAEETGIMLVPEEGALLVTREGLRAVVVMYDEGKVFVSYTVRALGELPIAWQPEGVSLDPPGLVAAASASIGVERGAETSRLTFYLVADSDLFRNVVFDYNATGVRELVDYLLERYSLPPSSTLVVVPVDFTIGSSPVDLARNNPVALFHPGILFTVLAQFYLSAEKSFLDFLYTQPLLLLATFLALSLLAYTIIARHIEEKTTVFTPPPRPRVIHVHGVTPVLETLLSRRVGRREARRALANLYLLLDTVLRDRYGKGVTGIAGDDKLLRVLGERTGIPPRELRRRLLSLHRAYQKASRKSRLPLPPVLSWKRILDKELAEVEPLLRAIGASLEEVRGIELGLIH